MISTLQMKMTIQNYLQTIFDPTPKLLRLPQPISQQPCIYAPQKEVPKPETKAFPSGRFTGYNAARKVIIIIANIKMANELEKIQVRPSTPSVQRAS